MQKIRNWLLGLLALQLLLLLFVWWVPTLSAENHPAKPLFAFKLPQVNKLVLQQGKQQVILLKQNQHWHLMDKAKLPADQAKVTMALTTLSQLKTNWPTAMSSAAQTRFKVAKDNYQRHVKLYIDNKVVADFYLGSSPSFRHSMLRVAGQGAIYSLAINSYDFSADDGDWFDKQLLALKSIIKINGADFSLTKPLNNTGKLNTKADDKPLWQLSASTDVVAKTQSVEQPLDQTKVQQLLNTLTQLRVQKRVALTIDKADFQLSASNGSKSVNWQFQHQGKQYLVKRDDVAGVFTLNQATFEQLQQAHRGQLLKQVKRVKKLSPIKK